MLHLRHMKWSNGRPTMDSTHCIGPMIGIEKRWTKLNKVNDWSGLGGHQSFIFVTSTSRSVSQQRYQSEVDRQGLQMRVIEKAGRSIKRMI